MSASSPPPASAALGAGGGLGGCLGGCLLGVLRRGAPSAGAAPVKEQLKPRLLGATTAAVPSATAAEGGLAEKECGKAETPASTTSPTSSASSAARTAEAAEAGANFEPLSAPTSPVALGGGLAEETDAPVAALLSCPWHDGLAFFLSSPDLARCGQTCIALLNETTVLGDDDGAAVVESSSAPSRVGKRLLLAPVLELRADTAANELRRVSLPHTHVVRVLDRLAVSALAEAVASAKRPGLKSMEKLVCKGCRFFPDDVGDFLVPAVSTTQMQLKLLNLEKNSLGDDVVIRLAASGVMARIETLNLRFNMVGDAGARAIANSGAHLLRWVNLKMNRITDEGAAVLAAKVARSPTMTLLNLRRQSPGLTDRTARAFAEALRENEVLEKLRLRRNRITETGAVALAEAVGSRMKALCTTKPPWEQVCFELDLEDNRIKTPGAIALLRAASLVPPRAKLELLLHGNTANREAVEAALRASGAEDLDASDARLQFHSKPEAIV